MISNLKCYRYLHLEHTKMCSYIIIIILHNENENYVNALCVYVVGVGLSVMVIIKYVETTNEVHA